MRVVKTLAGAGLLALASVAIAAPSPLVTVWSYTATSAFDPTQTVFDPNPPTVAGGPTPNGIRYDPWLSWRRRPSLAFRIRTDRNA